MYEFEKIVHQLTTVLEGVQYINLHQWERESIWEIKKLVEMARLDALATAGDELPSLYTSEETQRFGSR